MKPCFLKRCVLEFVPSYCLQKFHLLAILNMSIPAGIPLSEIPSLQPPPGVTPNFVNPPTIAPAVIAVNAVLLALMLVAVSIRIYCKGLLLRSLGWDDCQWLDCSKGFLANRAQIPV